MGSRGDLLALVDGAPGPLRTLQGALTTWTHRARAAAVHDRAVEEVGVRADQAAPIAALPGTLGWDQGETAEDGTVVDLTGGHEVDVGDAGAEAGPRAVWPAPQPKAVDHGPEQLTSFYVAVAMPNRWRVVGRGHLAVSDGRRSWAGTTTLVTERDSTRAAIHDAGVIGACLYPGPLLGGLELGSPAAAEIEGRPCWVVDAHPRAHGGGTAPASHTAPHVLRLHHDLVGIDHRLWFDASTGILLRHEGYIDGELCSSTELTDLVFGAPLDDDEFQPPPGAVVRSRHELLRDHLSEMGIDPDTVDLDDPAQVRAALRQGG